MLVPKPHATAIAGMLALLVPGQRAWAQKTVGAELETRLEAGAAMMSRPGLLPLSALAVTPGIRYANSRFAASARASAWLAGEHWRLGNAGASFETYTPLVYGLRAEVSANASRLVHDVTAQSDQVDAEARLHYLRQRGGLWLGSGVARPLRVAAVSNVNVSSGGVWTRFGPATLRGTVTSFLFTKIASRSDSIDGGAALCPAHVSASPAPDAVNSSADAAPSGCRHTSRLTDVEGSVRWEHHLMEVTVRGGQRFGDRLDVSAESRQWASAQAAVWISGQLAAVAGGGREPAQPTRGLPARSYGSLGLMLAYWPIPRGTVPVETPASMVRAFALREAGANTQRITARIGGVETVEIMGDFTDWQPLPLVRRGRDLWELLVPLGAGVHQINMRIDGGQWIAPPGMPTLRDGFNGEVGVLVIGR